MKKDSNMNNSSYALLIRNRNASPGGGMITKIHESRYCVNRPDNGAWKGLLVAKKDEYGRTPSRRALAPLHIDDI
jgi:hypothetical protein